MNKLTKDYLLSYARKATVAAGSAATAALIPAVYAVTQDGKVTLAECVIAAGGVLAATLAAFRLTFTAENT